MSVLAITIARWVRRQYGFGPRFAWDTIRLARTALRGEFTTTPAPQIQEGK